MAERNSNLPKHAERHALQALQAGNWKPTKYLFPTTLTTLTKMVTKGWIERREQGVYEYKITEAGRAAFRARLPGK